MASSASTAGGKEGGTATGMAGLQRNEVGGIAIDEAELRAAFEFFDVNGTGKITLSDLKV